MTVADSLKALVIAAVVVDTIGLALRSFARAKVQGSFGYDDAVLTLSLVAYAIFASFTLVALHYGYGVFTPEPWHNPMLAIKFFFVCQLTYVITSMFVKVGIALVLLRINVRRSFRYIIFITLGFFLTSAIQFLLLLALQCRPITSTWGATPGECFPYAVVRTSGIVYSGFDIAANFIYSFLPVAMIYNVQMSLRLKFSATFLLSIGFLSSIATVVRFKYIVQVHDRNKTLSKTEAIENNLVVISWTHVEIFLAILATSLIALRPLLRRGGELIQTWRRGNASSPDSKSDDEHELANGRPRTGSSRGRISDTNQYCSEVSLPREGAQKKLPIV
ncbi:hypothetical protein F4808DRAFT_296525 [Astrocystis sublimbata]|nr:hypothetical protein F4808DRAFT_296525 [Astrocystis sublimbata]